MQVFAGIHAHSAGQLEVSLPVDCTCRRGAFNLDDHVLDSLREVSTQVVDSSEGQVLVAEVQGNHVVADGRRHNVVVI